jgi:hypothetical protein
MTAHSHQVDELAEPGHERLAPIDLLRRFVASLRANKLDRKLALAVADRIELYFARAHEGLKLDDAFELVVDQGGEHWSTTELRSRRDGFLRAVDRMLSRPDFPLAARESTLHAALRRYETVWRRTDRHRNGVMPAEYAGTEREHLFAAFEANRQLQATAISGGDSRASGDFPMGKTTLRKILSG